MATITEIINTCGGPKAVADALGLKDGVRKWAQIGIPDRHWAKLIDMSKGKLKPATIFAANQQARSSEAA
jgi:hypothetical protein